MRPADHLAAVLDDLARLSRAIVEDGLPSSAPVAGSALAGVSARCRELWQAEVIGALEGQGLVATPAVTRAMLKVIHEARLAGIDEFRRRLADPTTAYRLDDATPAGDDGAEPPSDVVPPLPASAGDWGPRHRTVAREPRGRPRSTPSPAWTSLSVTEAAARYVASMPRAGGDAKAPPKRARRGWDDKTRRQFLTAAMLLGKSFTRPLWQITQDDLLDLSALFDRLPQSHHKSPRHAAMSLEAIADEAADMVAAGKLAESKIGLLPPTTNRHFRFLRQLCKWLRRDVPQMAPLYWDDLLFSDDRDDRDLRDAFTPEQGQALFALPIWTGCASRARCLKPGDRVFHGAAYWVPLLLWYSGARREEISKLMTADIGGAAGIRYIAIAVTPTGRIKNRQSKRLIPIAQELIRLGFLDFVEAARARGDTVLFPELVPPKPGRAMGDVFYKRHWRAIARHLPFLKPGQAVHAFRHMVSTELKDAEVYVETRNDLLGHVTTSGMAHRYSKATRLRKLAAIIDLIPNVTAHLEPVPQQVRSNGTGVARSCGETPPVLARPVRRRMRRSNGEASGLRTSPMPVTVERPRRRTPSLARQVPAGR
ncbi:Phage integrase family protein [Sphingomonas laterariae]|uniref:Phage integrase family protein n=2 Tax=Edaphosphingomonas laterariae TaxID=861865 RepID=A0A239I714_9SPHN|nr:Phage integrase family protein [Sphingomonas laterariae]